MSAPRRRTKRPLDVDIPRRRRRRYAKRRRPLLILLLIAAVLIAGAAVAGAGGVYSFGSSCDLSTLHEVRIGQNTFVYAADGSLLGAIPAERNRQVVPLSRVSPWIPKATIAIEDRRFYSHGGIDPHGIARAVVADVKARKVVQGGSTITQQLVRNLYISNERTVQRKLKEACLAIKLNDAWSKDKILAAYLNQVYYGNLAYGIEAAAQTYFSKHARDLNLRESALLAGLTQAPSAYNPFGDPAKAIARRDDVLQAMRDLGSISPEQYRWAVSARTLRLKPGRLYTEIREPYFFGYVRDQLIKHYGTETVRSGGLKVYTTIVPKLAALGAGRDPPDARPARRSRGGGDLDHPRHRCDPRDGRDRAGSAQQPVQPPLAGAPPARLDLQDVRARGGDRQGNRPGLELLRLRAVHLQAGRERELRRRLVVVREDVRLDLCGLDVGHPGHPPLRQFRLCAADARRRAGPRRRDGAQARRALPAAGEGALRTGDGPRLDRRLAARHGVRLRDARRGRRLLGADRDPQGRAPERQGGHEGGLGARRSGRA